LLAKVNLLRETSDVIEIIVPEEVKRDDLLNKTEDVQLISILIHEGKIGSQKADGAKAVKKLQVDQKDSEVCNSFIFLKFKPLY
jgi:hypothetical protein